MSGASPDAGDESAASLLAELGLERLRANPAAERCIDCQRRHEATHAGQPRASL